VKTYSQPHPGVASEKTVASLGDNRGLRPKRGTSDVENMLESTFSGVREADDSRIPHPSQPLHLNKAGQ
jgi:hypothetical protein